MANKYGSITVDGNLPDWILAEELDNSATTLASSGFMAPTSPTAPTCRTTCSASAPRAPTGTVIGAGTTIYLDTDNNKTTGFQIFGGIGAGIEIVFESADTPYLWAWNGTGFTQVGSTPLDFALNAGDTSASKSLCRQPRSPAPTASRRTSP